MQAVVARIEIHMAGRMLMLLRLENCLAGQMFRFPQSELP
jgi:hypothetical protein